ncbi:MAG: hypothetical protein AB8B88_03295 [Devosiaceae bacterium]
MAGGQNRRGAGKQQAFHQSAAAKGKRRLNLGHRMRDLHDAKQTYGKQTDGAISIHFAFASLQKVYQNPDPGYRTINMRYNYHRLGPEKSQTAASKGHDHAIVIKLAKAKERKSQKLWL